MKDGFVLFVYFFAAVVLGATLLLEPADLLAPLASGDPGPAAIVEINALRLLLSLGALILLLAALIWTFGQSYLFTKQIRDGYRNWASPVFNLNKRERFWIWRWVLFLWILLAMLITAATSDDDALFGRVILEGSLVGTAKILVLLVAGGLLARQAWTDVKAGIAPLGAVGLLFGAFVMLTAAEMADWGGYWFSGTTPAAGVETQVAGTGSIFDYGNIWLRHAPALILFFYVGFWPALGYIFPQIHFIMDRMALPIAPLSLLPIALIGAIMGDHAVFELLWGRPGWSVAQGREIVLALSLLLMVMFMRRYRGMVKDLSGSLTFRSTSTKRFR